MARLPRMHGLSLAGESYVENLRAERLDSDPVDLNAGRIWYNQTEKVLKHTTLDEGGAVVVTVMGDSKALDDVVSRVGGIEADYASQSFVEARVAELGNAFNYVGEITPAAREADALDVSALGATDAGAYYKADTAGYVVAGASGTAKYVNAGDGVLFNASSGIDVVDNTNSEIDGADDFVTVTGSTDTGFTVDLAASFKGRVTTLEDGLADEARERKSDVSGLSGRLDDAEALPGRINAQRFTYQSSAAAVEHAINHNLNSLFVAVDVWTEGEDGKYRKDIVTVEETNANRVTVFLTDTAKIKATVSVMEAL